MSSQSNLSKYFIDSLLFLIIVFVQVYTISFINLGIYGMFSPCGNDLLNQWNDLLIGFYISVGLLILYLIFTFLLVKKRTIIFKSALVLLSLSSFITSVYLGIDTIQTNYYYEDFNPEKWKNTSEKPITMIRTMYESKELIGLNISELEQKLGKTSIEINGSKKTFYYSTDVDQLPLYIILQNDKVTEISIGCHDLF